MSKSQTDERSRSSSAERAALDAEGAYRRQNAARAGSKPSRAPLTLASLVGEAARNRRAIAIEAPSRKPLTYEGLNRQIRETVATLNETGIGRNDRVAVVLPNGPEMAAAFVAIAAGAACAPLNPGYRAEEFDFFLADLGAAALVMRSGMDSPALDAARRRKIPVIELSPCSAMEAGRFTLVADGPAKGSGGGITQPDDIALVLHTSGTTSRPKLVPLTHGNIIASAHNIKNALGLCGDDKCLNILPLFHVHGLICAMLASFAAGGSVVCAPGFHPLSFFSWLDQFRPTWYTAVPAMHHAILSRAKSHPEVIARSRLRFIRSSSAALPPRLSAMLEKAFGVPVIEAYGMTEAAHQIASNPLPHGRRKPGTVGLAAGPEVAVMDTSGALLPRRQRGEIVIRGDNVMRGYENDPKANAEAFTEGWLRTGDLGFIDAEGYVSITGRVKEIINRGGEKIAPQEVDEVLLDHPAVAQAVTFAVPHPALGEEIGVAIVKHRTAAVTERQIREFAARRLASFKVPRHVVFVPDIPKGPTGKALRVGLADALGFAVDGSAPAKEDNTPPRNTAADARGEGADPSLGGGAASRRGRD